MVEISDAEDRQWASKLVPNSDLDTGLCVPPEARARDYATRAMCLITPSQGCDTRLSRIQPLLARLQSTSQTMPRFQSSHTWCLVDRIIACAETPLETCHNRLARCFSMRIRTCHTKQPKQGCNGTGDEEAPPAQSMAEQGMRGDDVHQQVPVATFGHARIHARPGMASNGKLTATASSCAPETTLGP